MAKGTQDQHNAITMVMTKAIALSRGLITATPMSLLSQCGKRREDVTHPKESPHRRDGSCPHSAWVKGLGLTLLQEGTGACIEEEDT